MTEIDLTALKELINKGHNIRTACKRLKIDRTLLYKKITPQQKIELNMLKTVNVKNGKGHFTLLSIADTIELFELIE